jgi:hypothetical protein
MPKITMEEQKEFPVLPADSILHLKIDSVEVREHEGRNGKFSKLHFKFKVLGIQATGDGSDPSQYEGIITEPIWGSVPFRFTDSPENRLRQWVEAIFAMELGVGFELDTDLLAGRECRGVTVQYEKRNTNPRTGLPFRGHQVDALLPKGGSVPQAQQWSQSQQQPQQPQQPQQEQTAVLHGGWEEPPF